MEDAVTLLLEMPEEIGAAFMGKSLVVSAIQGTYVKQDRPATHMSMDEYPGVISLKMGRGLQRLKEPRKITTLLVGSFLTTNTAYAEKSSRNC